jgi:hypothetical protein
MATRIVGLRGEFLWSLKLLSGKLSPKPNAFRRNRAIGVPSHKARSFSEGFVHVATGNFLLLDVIGMAAPVDLYAQIPADGGARFQGLIHRNDELAASMREKDTEIRTSRKNEG